MLILIKTVLAFAYTIITLIAYFPLGLPAFLLSLIGLKKPMSWVIYRLAQFWAKTIIFITGSTMEVRGVENIPKGGGICFVANHVGIVDVVLALAYIGRPFGFIAKKELSLVPFINMWILILGGLFIDRVNLRSALKTINRGIEKLRQNENMLIFPEGTRSKDRGLLPFKSGSIKLATQSFASIVPIAITGSYDVFEKNYRVQASTVRMVFCPPIFTSEMSPDERRHHLSDQVRGIIQDALENTVSPAHMVRSTLAL